jgi:hypothetical protein
LILALVILSGVSPVRSAAIETSDSYEPFHNIHTGCGTCGSSFDDYEIEDVEESSVFMPFTAATFDISEFNIESEHFIIHESLRPLLELRAVNGTAIAEHFNIFMERMDLVYKAMYDLVGTKPVGGAKIVFNRMAECPMGSTNSGQQHAHTGNNTYPYICWSEASISSMFWMNAPNPNWKYDATTHELGHFFHARYGWHFDTERWADYLAMLAIQKCGGLWGSALPMDSSTLHASNSSINMFVHPLFVNDPYDFRDWDDDSFEFGWGVLQQVFRTYPDIRDLSRSDDEMLVDFVGRIAAVLGMDLDTYLNTYVTAENRTKFPGKSLCPDCGYLSCVCPPPFECPDCGHLSCICFPIQTGDVIIPSIQDPDNIFINLTTETITLPENFSVAAYSTDGGKKWKRGTLPAENRFPRLLNKGMTLHVTSDFDRKGKKPAADAQTITFPKIDARPKRNADKLKPFYGDENWVLAKKGSTAAVFAGLEYAPSANGKTPDDNWLPMPQDGLPVLDSRATVLVRTAPTAARAASTAWRVRPAVFGKAPNYKVKNDEITVRANTYVSLPDGTVTLHREKKKIPVVSGMEVWNAATGRRPAGLRQVFG